VATAVSAAGIVISLVMAITALVFSLNVQRRTSHSDAVYRAYDAFATLGSLRADNWQAAHLWELPEAYHNQVLLTRAAIGHVNNQERARILILERTVAIQIFGVFEQVLYSHTLSTRFGEKDRTAFMHEVQSFFTERLLRNPRLVYLWAEDGGGLCRYAEPETRATYSREVWQADDELASDPIGPFDDADPVPHD
jgi:hypothetical protein